METTDEGLSSFIELSDDERISLYDQAVIPLFRGAGKQLTDVSTHFGYRHYSLHPTEWQSAQVVDTLNKMFKLFRGQYVHTALLNIKDHPQVLNSDRKIHLQPKPQDLLKIVEILARSLSQDDNLYQQVNQFKVTSNSAFLKSATSQPLVVVYLMANADMDQLIASFVDKFADFTASGGIPRFNQQHSPIVFSAEGDGTLKDWLKRYGELDRFYDAHTNYSGLKPQIEHFSPTMADILKRPIEESFASLFIK